MYKYVKNVALKVLLVLIAASVFVPTTPAVQAASLELYKLGAGDVLEIIVWREEALSRSDVLVRPDGRISLPLVDDILAEGRTPMQLKATITKELLKYVEAPKVYVTVKDPRSHSYTVVGHVVKPGTYPMFRATSILQALAEAGSFDEWADKDDIKIVRGHGANTRILTFDYEEFMDMEEEEEEQQNGETKQKLEAQNIILDPGDVIIVP
jgi:polysaccharide export outer membrane protein